MTARRDRSGSAGGRAPGALARRGAPGPAAVEERLICPRCNCCEQFYQTCENCGGDGVYGHDCGEDACCCRYPEENVTCDICNGAGSWLVCMGNCDEHGLHAAVLGRARARRGK
jgi:hypothetical protein